MPDHDIRFGGEERLKVVSTVVGIPEIREIEEIGPQVEGIAVLCGVCGLGINHAAGCGDPVIDPEGDHGLHHKALVNDGNPFRCGGDGHDIPGHVGDRFGAWGGFCRGGIGAPGAHHYRENNE